MLYKSSHVRPFYAGLDERNSGSMEHMNRRSAPGLKAATPLDTKQNNTDAALPLYERPRILTYTDEQILELLGPAQTSVYP